MEIQKFGFTMEEAAALSAIGRTKIYAAVKDGKLKARKYGRRTVILASDLQMFLENLPAREAA